MAGRLNDVHRYIINFNYAYVRALMENRILVTENSEVRSAWTEETG